MYFTWDTTNICILVRQWHVRSTAGLITSLLVVTAVAAGYVALGKAIRQMRDSANKTAETAQSTCPEASLRLYPAEPDKFS